MVVILMRLSHWHNEPSRIAIRRISIEERKVKHRAAAAQRLALAAWGKDEITSFARTSFEPQKLPDCP